MGTKTLSEAEREALLSRGPVSELELCEWELDGLNPQDRLSIERRRIFLRTFALRGNVSEGCRAAGVSRNLIYHWRDSSEWFETLYDAAQEEAADRIEAEAFRRAVEGYDEPIVYQGMMTTAIDAETGEERVVTVRKYSDALMQTMLKGARPEKYRDNHKVEHEIGAGGVLMVPAAVDQATWEKVAREGQAKYAGNEGTQVPKLSGNMDRPD